jgi:sec-independent protein translocase protein TatB
MFGIGFGELLIIAIVVLIAVGPRRMPAMMKSVGRGLRELRKATRELRAQVGLDEILHEDDSLHAPPPRAPSRGEGFGAGGSAAAAATGQSARATPGQEPTPAQLRQRELPAEGVDLAEAEFEARVAELGALEAQAPASRARPDPGRG